ncbi:hypothetical protein MVEN_02567900 [Mycena venus]|uniref:C2H2-type domain-containing protein n=1 Tax=Mycena venus TaxID=2733690 RepID=A0A8H6TZD4_9AGAR|nr:hypothetical protein MVEN_02567900 [Mycena venus]
MQTPPSHCHRLPPCYGGDNRCTRPARTALHASPHHPPRAPSSSPSSSISTSSSVRWCLKRIAGGALPHAHVDPSFLMRNAALKCAPSTRTVFRVPGHRRVRGRLGAYMDLDGLLPSPYKLAPSSFPFPFLIIPSPEPPALYPPLLCSPSHPSRVRLHSSLLSTDDPIFPFALAPSFVLPFVVLELVIHPSSSLLPVRLRMPIVLCLHQWLRLRELLLVCVRHASLFRPPTPYSALFFPSALLISFSLPACTTLTPSLHCAVHKRSTSIATLHRDSNPRKEGEPMLNKGVHIIISSSLFPERAAHHFTAVSPLFAAPPRHLPCATSGNRRLACSLCQSFLCISSPPAVGHHILLHPGMDAQLGESSAPPLWLVNNAARVLEIIVDIDHRFPGLRRFPHVLDFSQWACDNSKALMRIFHCTELKTIGSTSPPSLPIFPESPMDGRMRGLLHRLVLPSPPERLQFGCTR